MNKAALVFNCAEIKGDAGMIDPQLVAKQHKPFPSFQKASPAPFKKKPVKTAPAYNKKKQLEQPNKDYKVNKPVAGKVAHNNRAPVKPKYICVTDILSKLDSSNFNACKRSDNECPMRHIPKPAPGHFAAKDKGEIIISINKINGISTQKRTDMLACINVFV